MCELKRRITNEIVCIEANRAEFSEVEEIKDEIFKHFKDIFKSVNTNRLQMQSIDYN